MIYMETMEQRQYRGIENEFMKGNGSMMKENHRREESEGDLSEPVRSTVSQRAGQNVQTQTGQLNQTLHHPGFNPARCSYGDAEMK